MAGFGPGPSRVKVNIMSKPVRSIRCYSSDEKLQNVFRSMIRVYCQFTSSGLNHEWVYREHDSFNLDVQILDLDDESNWSRFQSFPDMIVIAISKHPELMSGQRYTLDKPLRSHSLLQVLQVIETSESFSRQVEPARLDPDEGTDFSSVSLGLGDSPEPGTRDTPSQDLVYRLQTWPDLSALPEDRVLEISRVCALLSVRPANPGFIADFLDIPATEVEQVLALIRLHAYPGYPALAEAPRQLQAVPDTPAAAPESVSPPTSFLSKIWNRLKGAA